MRFFFIVIFSALPCLANAASIDLNTLDSSGFSFSIEGSIGLNSSTGTSNGIGYTAEYDSIFVPFSNNSDGDPGTEPNQSYPGLSGSYEALHLSSDFTLTFNSAISSLIVALANDPSFGQLGDGPDFGVTPEQTSGNVSVSGTKVNINSLDGGLALFEFASPITSFSHTNDCPPTGGLQIQCDGFDVTFFAFAAIDDGENGGGSAVVPLPASFSFLMVGLGGIGLLAARRQRRK